MIHKLVPSQAACSYVKTQRSYISIPGDQPDRLVGELFDCFYLLKLI